MIVVIQRVTHASVTVESQCIAKIGHGLLILVGIEKSDADSDVRFMVEKIPQLRIFADTQGHMNHSLQDINGELLLGLAIHLTGKHDQGTASQFRRRRPPRGGATVFPEHAGTIQRVRRCHSGWEVRGFNEG